MSTIRQFNKIVFPKKEKIKKDKKMRKLLTLPLCKYNPITEVSRLVLNG